MKTRRTKARRAVRVVVLSAALLGVGSVALADDIGTILTGYGAKETCSCVFVVGQTDAYCQDFGQGDQTFRVDLAIDHSAKTVTASGVLGASRTARFADGAGCTLDPP